MRKLIVVTLSMALLASSVSAEAAPLPPGKPAGTKEAALLGPNLLLVLLGGAVVFGGLAMAASNNGNDGPTTTTTSSTGTAP